MKVPKKLYLGTSPKNASSICRYGLLVGTVATCSPLSERKGFDWDCIGNVSLAVDKKDAILFASSSQPRNPGEVPSQLIVEIDTDKLQKEKMVPRSLFGKRNKGVKYYDNVPKDAISKLILREFVKDSKGKLQVVTKSGSCEDLMPLLSGRL